MRSLAGLLLALVAAGCGSPARYGCSSCGPVICVERHNYCRCLDDWHSGLAARRCALKALGICSDVSPDYRRGFVQAYVDIAQGATGATPPIPPERYWSACLRSGCGRMRADEWFAGYSDGAARALTCYRGGTVPSSGVPYVTGPPHQHGMQQGFAPENACQPTGSFSAGW